MDKLEAVLVAGDTYMKPELLAERIHAALPAEAAARLEFRTVDFPYPVESIPLHPHTVIPSGMSYSSFEHIDRRGDIAEYYGDRDALGRHLEGINILIVHGAAVPREVLEASGDLRLICALRGGPKNVDIKAAGELGIRVVNTPGKTARAVAEFTLGGLLGLTRNIVPGSLSLQAERVWKPDFFRYEICGFELAGKTVGLIGFGHIARELVALLSGFALGKILAYDPHLNEEEALPPGVRPAALEELLEQSDIVSLHARLTPGSRGLIGDEEFARMARRRPVFINTARGGLLDYQALIRALKKKQVRGAVLDVFGDDRYEVYEELLAMPNTVCTPHIAGGSRETVERAAAMIAEELRRYLAGLPLKNEM